MSTPTLREAAEKALVALEYMHTEKVDYMIRNNLGDPLRETASRLAVPAMEDLRAALAAPAEPRVEPAPHPSTPIAALLQQYADECSDFSGPDGYAFALKIANRYAESGPDCQMRCVVHTLLNPPEPATQGEPAIEHCLWARNGHARCPVPAAKPLTDERIDRILDALPEGCCNEITGAEARVFARAIEAAHGITGSAAGAAIRGDHA